MVGFNRRFSPHCKKIKSLLTDKSKNFVFTFSFFGLFRRHWIQDMVVEGGFFVNVPFIDLLRFLADSPIISFDRT